MRTNSIIDAAIAYVKLGYKVFPCVQNGKEPIGRLAPRGCYNATDDIGVVRAWWEAEPGANIGVATGDGLVVIDVDCDPITGLDGYQTLHDLETELGPLPQTRRVRTPRGGMHIYLQCAEGAEYPNSSGKLGPGIDVRGDGGYVIGAGSQIDMVYYADIDADGNPIDW